jgi:hypothetical protein
MQTLLITAALLLGGDDPPKKPLLARPAALVLKVKGVITAEGRLGKRRVEAGDFLLPGETVSAAPAAEALLVFLVKGERRRFRPGSRATLTRDGCDPADAVERVGPAKLPHNNLTKVREVEVGEGGSVGTLRTLPSATETRVRPLFGTFVTTERPSFSWPPVEKAESYVVELKDAAGGKLWQAVAREATLDYPDKKPLSAGAKYLWSVKARLAGGDEKEVVRGSNFKLLLKGERQELATVRKLADSDTVEDLLLAAAACEGYGVLDEALKVFEKLARLQPQVARWQLALYHYYRRAGQPDRAKEALDRAKKLGAAIKE